MLPGVWVDANVVVPSIVVILGSYVSMENHWWMIYLYLDILILGVSAACGFTILFGNTDLRKLRVGDLDRTVM